VANAGVFPTNLFALNAQQK